MAKNNKLSKKETRAFGKGIFELIRGISENNVKAMDSIIVHPETGKRYILSINELSN